MEDINCDRRQVLRAAGASVAVAGLSAITSSGGAMAERGPSRSDADWPMVGADRGNTGHNAEASPPASGVAVDWHNHFVDASTRQVAADGVGMVLDANGNLYEIDLEDGTTESVIETWSENTLLPAATAKRSYIGVHHSIFPDVVIASEEDTDEPVWERNLTDVNIQSSPTVVDDAVCFRTQDGLLAFDADTGDAKWTAEIGGGGDTPAVEDGTIYTLESGWGDDRSTVYAVDGATGETQWTWSREGSVGGPLVVANGHVYFYTDDGSGWMAEEEVIALDVEEGEELWRAELEDTMDAPVTVDGDTVYAATDELGRVYAFDVTTGEKRWQDSVSGGVTAQPVVSGDTVYVVSDEEVVCALDAENGTERWNATLPVGDSATLALAGDRLIVAGSTVIALEPGEETSLEYLTDGLPVEWRYSQVSAFSSQPIAISNNRVVFGGSRTIYTVDPTDGDTEWEDDDVGSIEDVAGADDGLYVTSSDSVTALEWGGDVRWEGELERTAVMGPAVGDDGVYVGEGDGSRTSNDDDVVAFEDGEERWRYETAESLEGLAVTGDTVVAETAEGPDSTLYGLEASSGDERWTLETGSDDGSGVIAVGGMVLAGDGTDVRLLTAADGEERWTVETESQMRGATAADGLFYVVVKDSSFGTQSTGGVYAIEADSGEIRWSRRIGASTVSPAVVDGTVYVANQDGTVYALEGDTGDVLAWRHFGTEPVALETHDETLIVLFRDSIEPTALDVSETVTEPLDLGWPMWSDRSDMRDDDAGDDGTGDAGDDETDDGTDDGTGDDSSPGFGLFGAATGLATGALYRALTTGSDGET